MDKDYIMFVLGYDLLNKEFSNSSNPECDIVYDKCRKIAEDFLKYDYINTTESLYEALVVYVDEKKHLKFLEDRKKLRNIEVKTNFNGWKKVSYEQAKDCIKNWIGSILTKSGQKTIDYINKEKLKGITVEEILKYEEYQNILFKNNLILWKDGIYFAKDRIKTFYNKEKDSKDEKYITLKEFGEIYSKRLANLMFELGYGEWVYIDYGKLDKMQEQMIDILEDDNDLEEILKDKEITKNSLFEQIKGYVLEGEIEKSDSKEQYKNFVKNKIQEDLLGKWLKPNEFDFLNNNLTELSEKCFTELNDNMTLEEELDMIDRNVRVILDRNKIEEEVI